MHELGSGTLHILDSDVTYELHDVHVTGEMKCIDADNPSEYIHKLADSLEFTGVAISNATRSFLECTTVMNNFINRVLSYSPTGRIRHLATHAKKERVRKKNWRRIIKQFEKEAQQ